MLEGRHPAFAHRAINCFLGQTYDRKELVIVAEKPGRFAHYLHNRTIKLIRARETTDTGKVTQGINESSGDIVFRWDDDDISFPYRVVSSIEEIRKSSARVMGLTAAFFYEYETKKIYYCPRIRDDYFHPSGVMWRDAWEGRNECKPEKFAPLENITIMMIGAHPGNTINKRGWMTYRTNFEVPHNGYRL